MIEINEKKGGRGLINIKCITCVFETPTGCTIWIEGDDEVVEVTDSYDVIVKKIFKTL